MEWRGGNSSEELGGVRKKIKEVRVERVGQTHLLFVVRFIDFSCLRLMWGVPFIYLEPQEPVRPSTGRWVPVFARWVGHFGQSGTLSRILRPVTDARITFRPSLKWWEGHNQDFPAVTTDFNCVSGRCCHASPERPRLNDRLGTSGRLWLCCMAKHHLAPSIVQNLHVSARSQNFYHRCWRGTTIGNVWPQHNRFCAFE